MILFKNLVKTRNISFIFWKIVHKIFRKKSSDLISWLEANKSDFSSYCASIDSDLWSEAQEFSFNLEKYGNSVCDKIPYDLGGLLKILPKRDDVSSVC